MRIKICFYFTIRTREDDRFIGKALVEWWIRQQVTALSALALAQWKTDEKVMVRRH